jgi:hypothetical protein
MDLLSIQDRPRGWEFPACSLSAESPSLSGSSVATTVSPTRQAPASCAPEPQRRLGAVLVIALIVIAAAASLLAKLDGQDSRNAFLHGSKVQNFYLPPYPPHPNTLIVGLSK